MTEQEWEKMWNKIKLDSSYPPNNYFNLSNTEKEEEITKEGKQIINTLKEKTDEEN